VSDFKAKCTKFDLVWGSAPDPAGELTALPRPAQTPLGELTALHRPPAGFKGPTSKGREGREGEREGKEG